MRVRRIAAVDARRGDPSHRAPHHALPCKQSLAQHRPHDYALCIHNFSALHRLSGDGAVVVSAPAADATAALTHSTASSTLVVAGGAPVSDHAHSPLRARLAQPADAFAIAALIAHFTADGSLLPRSVTDVTSCIESYVVVPSPTGEVLACAALFEYSPSLAEVGSVAVAKSAQGHGLGTVVVRAVERLARLRGHRELFAISLADHFFGHLGYRAATLDRYPEKIARYAVIAGKGTSLVPKRCFRKRLRAPRLFPRVANSTGLVSVPTVYHANPRR